MMGRRRASSPNTAALLALLYASVGFAATNQLPIANAGSDHSGTAGSAVVLDGSHSTDPDGSVAAYWWIFGDGASVTVSTPTTTHVYTAPGNYAATLWVRDNAGAWSATSDVVMVSITGGTVATTTTTTLAKTTTTLGGTNVPPVPNAGPNQSAQSLISLTFNGSASRDPDGTITFAQWTFGDGANAGGLTATHAYAHPGTYTATLTVIDDRGASAADTAVVTILNRAPVAAAGADVSGAPGVAVSLNGSGSYDSDGTITGWAWSFGDGTSGSGAVPTHAYAAVGTYTATLTVTDDKGATATDAATVSVSGGSATTWSRRFGGTDIDGGYAIIGDAAGNTYVGGSFRGTIDVGGTSLKSAGGNDWFLAKLSGSGSVIWAKRWGGSSEDLLDALAIGSDGGLVATGRFSGSASFGGASLTANGTVDMVVVKYDGATGAHVWSRSFGGAYDDAASAVAIDGANNVLFTGYIRGVVDFGGGALRTPYDSDLDVFVCKLSSAGAHVWSKHFTNTGNERGYGIAADAAGNVAIGGYFSNAVDFGGGSLVSGNAMTDAFVARFTANGAYSWARRMGATDGNEGVYGVAMDGSGNVVVSGYAIKPVDFGGGLLAALGSSDAFVAKYAASSGAHQWSRRLGGLGNDYGYGVAVDASGNIYVAGAIGGLASFGGLSLPLLGSSDGFLAKFGPTGTPLWARDLGGIDSDVARAVGMSAGAPVVTGYFYSSGSFNGATLTSAGGSDAFAVRMAP